MHHILARITFRPDAIDAGKRLLTELATASRKEPGCISYELYQQSDAPHIFQTVEQWASKADADAHMQTPHLAAAVAAGTPLFGAPPEILAHAKLM